MASNEHRNLQDPNIHDPKGFRSASNETVLTKGSGAGGYQNGSLQWVPKYDVGTKNYIIQGYLTGTLNYKYGEDVANNKSPYLMDNDFGSGTLTAESTISPTNLFRTGQSFYVNCKSKVLSIKGYITMNTANSVVIAICKATPISGSSSNITVDVVDEITIVGGNNNNILVPFSETVITSNSLSEGDIIFPMAKEVLSEGAREFSSIYINGTIETCSDY